MSIIILLNAHITVYQLLANDIKLHKLNDLPTNDQ